MRKQLVLFALILTTSLYAQSPMEITLWPDGVPNNNGLQGNEKELEPNRISNVTVPTLTVYRPQKPNGVAIIMCPGGGYTRLAMDHEGYDMAPWFNSQGITYAVLKYRMPNGHSDVPLSDAEQAVRIVRQHVEAWEVNPSFVGIMGASAGGHLASTLATHYSSEETRPDFQILLYPVITMDKSYTHMGSHDNLLGKTASAEQEKKFSNELQVNGKTPKAFIALSSDDNAVPAANGVNYYMALVNNEVPASLHTYPIGGHGWGFRDRFVYKHQWTTELEKWLQQEVIAPCTNDKNPVLSEARKFIGTPYIASTLEVNDEEKLVVNLKEVDCTTLVEYVLAKATKGDFTSNLQRIRYRDGKINGYTSRLHYIADWVENGVNQGIIADVTAANSPDTEKLSLSYMSKHPQLYKSLKNSPENVKLMAKYEKALTGKTIHYLPKTKLKAEGLPWIKDGDIIALCTNIPGLDVSHMGIACYVDGKLHLLNASSVNKKVEISAIPLSDMLAKSKSNTGIRVMRLSAPRRFQTTHR
ncbi:N-acetylmuramoyl-L-alanine amidase-like domain-containing protein [Bacteroides sp.]